MGEVDFIIRNTPVGPDTVDSDAIIDGDVTRADLNTATVGSAVITKIIAGTNITITETGADSGTGDVTVNATSGGGSVTFHQDKSSDSSITGVFNGANKSFAISNTPIANSVLLHLNGIELESPTHYSMSGAAITMVDAPNSGDNLMAYYAT